MGVGRLLKEAEPELESAAEIRPSPPEDGRETGHLTLGRSLSVVPISWTMVTAFLFVVLIGSAIFLATASYARKETVRGVIRPSGGDLRVAAGNSGVVTSVLVSEGQVVQRGTPLVVVSTMRRFEGGDTAYELLLHSLSGEEAALRSRLSALAISQGVDGEVLRQQIGALEAELQSMKEIVRTADERLKIAQERLEVARRLDATGYISRDEMRRREDAVIVQEQSKIQAGSQSAKLSAQLVELRSRERQRPFAAVQERGQLEAGISAISQRRAEAEAQKGFVLEAPVRGRVTALRALPGQPTAPSQVLMTITPLEAELVAEVYVPSRAIGFVRPGMEARLLVDAFPYQKFGPLYGRVASVSKSVLDPEELHAPVELKEPMYVVAVTLTRNPSSDGSATIQPGMALSADIVLEKRSFLAWLFDPALAVHGRL